MGKRIRQIRSLSEIMLSSEMEAELLKLGERVEAAASTDPNPAYVETLETHVFRTRDRVHVQVGAAPGIGLAVEAKRGTLARALGSVGG